MRGAGHGPENTIRPRASTRLASPAQDLWKPGRPVDNCRPGCQHVSAVVGNSRARGVNPPHIGGFRVSRDERTASHRSSSQAVHPPLVGNMGAHAIARAESDDEECDQNCEDRNHRSHPLAPLNHLLTGIWPNYDRYWAFWVARSTGRQPKQRAADADARRNFQLQSAWDLGDRRNSKGRSEAAFNPLSFGEHYAHRSGGVVFRRKAMKPTPANPSTIMAQVDVSGTEAVIVPASRR